MKLKKQNSLVIWLLGLSGAGKSTLATLLSERLTEEKFTCVNLDGDILRKGINADLGFSVEDRSENIRRAAETAKILSDQKIITICSFITPLAVHRQIAKKILQDRYFEVFIDCPIEKCLERDVKGLYNQANSSLIKEFTGISSSFESPENPDLILNTANESVEESLDRLYQNAKRLLAI